jgi:hypothetical protein
MMRARGINYDTGFLPGKSFSRPDFDLAEVQRDMEIIAGELHCDAVRVSGGRPDRLSVAAEVAAAAGLEVWFAPFPVDLKPPQMLALLDDCAQRAERIRRAGKAVVLVTGCETSLFGNGFMPGDTWDARLTGMTEGGAPFWEQAARGLEPFAAFLAESAATARRHFGGPITYAAGPWEQVDWAPFDYAGVDAYRAAYNRDTFEAELAGHAAQGKPVAVTEFGTCPYRGAGDLGGLAWKPPADAVYDEGEQVRYFTELSDVFERLGIDTALWFTYVMFKPVGDDGLNSYGVIGPGGERGVVFVAIAQRYAKP